MDKKKIFLTEGVQEKLENAAKAIGSTADELASKIVLEKATAETGKPARKERKGKSAEKKSEAQRETAIFPAKGMVNAYGFFAFVKRRCRSLRCSAGQKGSCNNQLRGRQLSNRQGLSGLIPFNRQQPFFV